MKKREKEAKRSKKFEELDLTFKTRPEVHIKPKSKKPVLVVKYGVFTCSRCGGPKSGKSPGTLCYGCKHPGRKMRPIGKRRKKRRVKKNRRARNLASVEKRYRRQLVLRRLAVKPRNDQSVDELVTDILSSYYGGDTDEAR